MLILALSLTALALPIACWLPHLTTQACSDSSLSALLLHDVLLLPEPHVPGGESGAQWVPASVQGAHPVPGEEGTVL